MRGYAKARMKVLATLDAEAENPDTEVAHANADDAVMEYLRDIGESQIVESFEKINKWYA